MRNAALSLAAALTMAGCSHSTMPKTEPSSVQAEARKSLPPPEGSKALSGSLEAFNAACTADLERARAQVAALKSMKPAADGRAVLEAYDEATAALGASFSRSSLAREVHPDAAFRDAARACEQKADALNVDISQDRGVYDALSAVDLSQSDAATRYWMERTLLNFRRAGVDRDDTTRAKVKSLNEELLKLGQSFNQNIAEDVRKVELDPKELAGLPEDFIKAHAPGANGKVVLTSNYPDYFPFMTYARDGKAREKVWRAYRQRAYPKNVEVLNQLIAKRHELATLLGYPTWAAYVTETKMTRTQQTASDFIDKVAATAEKRAKQEYAELLARKQKDEPKATVLEPWDQDYYADRVQAEQLGFDSQALRPYFEYGRVKKGVMDITSRMWGITFVPVKDASVWHSDVETYDITENGTPLGRIYLDMHPREDKYKHAAQFDVVAGQAGKRYPEGALVCNFPRPGELMTQDEVETFFHEFGHLLHHVFAGRQQWTGITGISTEWDFVETPSMLLQQWASNPTVLQEFARHHQTGETIPTATGGEAPGLEGVRQGPVDAPADVPGRRVAGLLLARAGLRHHRRDEEAAGEVQPVPPRVPGRHALPARLRAPGGVLGRLLHVRVVARHRQGPGDRVPEARLPGPGHHHEVPQEGARARWLQARRRAGEGLPRPALWLRGLPRVPRREVGLRTGSHPDAPLGTRGCVRTGLPV